MSSRRRQDVWLLGCTLAAAQAEASLLLDRDSMTAALLRFGWKVAAVALDAQVVSAAGVEGSGVDLVVSVACQCPLTHRCRDESLPSVSEAAALRSCC